jgi:hypothetical protein
MLKILRHKNVTKIVLWAILILIMPAFVIWGTGNLGGSKEKGPKFVGVINRKKVTFDEFAGALGAMRSHLILNYQAAPEALNSVLKNRELLGRLAWDRIIMQREARARGIKIANRELVDVIRSHPLFLRGGKFDEGIYNYFLRYNLGIEPRDFEEMMRDNLAIQKMNDAQTKDMKASDEEVREAYGKENGRFKISYAIFPAAAFADKVEVTDDEIARYYEMRKEDYVVAVKEAEAEQAEKKYMSLEDVRAGIKTIVAELKAVPLARERAAEEREKIASAMEGREGALEDVCKELGLETGRTDFFSRTDVVNGIGEARDVAIEAAALKPRELSRAIAVRAGGIIFTVTDTLGFDEEKFEKDRDEYAKKVLEAKKNRYLEGWLRRLEEKASLNISLADYEKYYR